MEQKITPLEVSSLFVNSLIYGVSHDIGASLRHVVQFSQLLETAAGEQLDDKHRRWLEMIKDSGKRAQEMLASLTTLSKLAKAPVETQALNLQSIRDGILRRYQERIDHESIVVTVSDHWPVVSGCEQHWQMLLSCLLENALVFQPKDSKHQAKVNIECKSTDTCLKLMVEDNGIGLSTAQRQDILRPFKRLNHTDEYPGLGVGLTYCYYIAELNGASLSFDDSSLGGLSVVYTQPLQQSLASNVLSMSNG